MTLRSICVFSGSSPGRRPEYAAAAERLGAAIAGRGLRLVYGGARVGLMGLVADAALGAGGAVTGVIPSGVLEKEVAHRGLDDLRVVGSMHERKQLMSDLSDGFVALPGGLGTLEEFFEVLTWAQLGLHTKPCGLLDVAGYYQPLTAFLDHTVTEEFVAPTHRSMVLVEPDVDALLDAMATYRAPVVKKWLDAAGS